MKQCLKSKLESKAIKTMILFVIEIPICACTFQKVSSLTVITAMSQDWLMYSTSAVYLSLSPFLRTRTLT